MLRVGLTGGIGAGKSTVSAELAALGAVVVDADELARRAVEPGTPGLAEIVEAFGAEVLAPDGTLDRPALARVAFADDDSRRRLNGILHPRIAELTVGEMASAPPDAVVVHDVPLLVENGLAPDYQLVLVVNAPLEERVGRLVRDRGMAEDEVRARMAAQADDEQRRAVADVLLDNGGVRAEVLDAVRRLWHERLVPFEANLRAGRPAPRPDQVMLADPDPDWPTQAARVIARVARVGGSRARRVDHIGSTSVPGLIGKDVLDVQVVVPDLATALTLADDLLDAGLVRRPDVGPDVAMDGRPYAEAFAREADPGRPVNCHVRPEGSPAWRETLTFRNRLRASPALAAEYAELKRRLAADRYPTADDCARAKTPFVRRVLMGPEGQE